MKKLRLILLIFSNILIVTACSLREPCTVGKHWDMDTKSCEPDNPAACGFEAVNCNELYGVFYLYGLSYDKDCSSETVSHSDEKCSHKNPTCDEGVCHFDCDDSKSFYHIYNNDDSSLCVPSCECDLYSDGSVAKDCSEDKIQACIDLICNNNYGQDAYHPQYDYDEYEKKLDIENRSNKAYCVSTADELLNLKSWIDEHKQNIDTSKGEKLNVYLIENIDLSETNETWNPFDLENVKLVSFGGINDRKTISYPGVTLGHGLFYHINNSLIGNIGVKLTVEGDNAYGILADKIENSEIYDVSIDGSLKNNKDEQTYQLNLFDLDYFLVCSSRSGVGGLSGVVKNSTLVNLQLGNKDFYIEAENLHFVGGVAGILCDSNLYTGESNNPEKSNNFTIASITGKSAVGGLFGGVGGSNGKGTLISSVNMKLGNVNGQDYVGGIAGFTDMTSSISSVRLDNLSGNDNFELPTISGDEYVGGVVGLGLSNFLLIDTNIGSVTGTSHVGGLAGYLSSHLVTDIKHHVKNVTGEDYVGGMIGRNYSDLISCTNHVDGTVQGKQYVGGMIGSNDNGNITGSLLEKDEISAEDQINEYDNHVFSVIGNHGVGGFIGLVSSSEINHVYSTVNTVEGNEQIGGEIGLISRNPTINHFFSKVEKVTGLSKIGGFVGEFRSGLLMNSHHTISEIDTSAIEEPPCDKSKKADCIEGDDREDWHDKAVGGFVGYMDKDAVILGTEQISGTNNKNAFTSTVSKITANNQCAGGFAGYLNGSISSVTNHIVSIDNEFGNDIWDWTINGIAGTGGFAGCADDYAMIQHVDTTSESVIAKGKAAGGAIGILNGYIIDVTNHAKKVLAIISHAGGFVASANVTAHISDIQNNVDEVYTSLVAGGFAGEADGEITNISTKANRVSSYGMVGGAFGACGGSLHNIVNFIDDVELLDNTRLNPQNNCDSDSEKHCHTILDKEYCYTCSWVKAHLVDNASYRQVGGFVGYGDGMHDTVYAAIINRAVKVTGSSCGGFMGTFNFRGYINRIVILENISSFANINPATNDTKNSGLFMNNFSGIDNKNTGTATFSLRNIYIMGEFDAQSNGGNETTNFVAGNSLYSPDILSKLQIKSRTVYAIDNNEHDNTSNRCISSLGEKCICLGTDDDITLLEDNICYNETWCENKNCETIGDLSDKPLNNDNVGVCHIIPYQDYIKIEPSLIDLDSNGNTSPGAFRFWDDAGMRPDVNWKIVMSNKEEYSIADESVNSHAFFDFTDPEPMFTFEVK